MSPTTQKNIRLDEHYLGMIAFFSERFDRSLSEVIRTALDHMNAEYGAALRAAELFIAQLRERHGEDAVLEFRRTDGRPFGIVEAPAGYATDHLREVHVGGELDADLQGILGGLRTESGAFDPNEALYLMPRAWDVKRVPTPQLYVGSIDPKSDATISIRVADLNPAMQEFGSLLASRGRPLHRLIWSQGGSGRLVTDDELEASD